MQAPDLSPVRERFPALQRRLDGRACVYLDAPGGSQVPDTVIDAMVGYLRSRNSNTHGAFVTSVETDELIAEARRSGAAFTGADPDEIVFGPNATTLLFAFSRAVGRELGPGDEVLVTTLDHDANITPWVMAAEDAGATVRTVDIREEDATLDIDSFRANLSERTKVAAFTLASNAVGTVTPAPDLVRAVRDASPHAIVAVDAVHVAQHRALDLHGLGADVLACSPYKFFGPHLGILAARRDLLERLRPYKVRPAEDVVPDRWETGTKSHEGLAGLVAAVGYIASVGAEFGEPAEGTLRGEVLAGMEAIRTYERTLSARFLDGLSAIPALRLWGIADPARLDERTPTFAVRVGEQHPLETASALGQRGIFVWDGHYYALALMERLGLQETGGAVRVGLCHYNTPAEVDRILEELAALT
jgi:cysteine desulfurase family protein (TIGR01976 family)